MKYHLPSKKTNTETINKKQHTSQRDLKRIKKLQVLQNVINKDSNEIMLLKTKLSKSKQLLETILSKVEKRQDILLTKIRIQEAKKSIVNTKYKHNQFDEMTRKILEKTRGINTQSKQSQIHVLQSHSSLKYSPSKDEFIRSKDKRDNIVNNYIQTQPVSSRISKANHIIKQKQIVNNKIKQKLTSLGKQLRQGVDRLKNIRQQFQYNKQIKY